ncbi:hypothetical protein K443DRAFT_14136 [Laccaria amethystina LaAM-08-1]|uniref:Unplaced genomic scaffold K443scaffold_437, whole genome shotgun sequence n=1 Tax=Laccaria amethystina LaAM-08-1 TaxID=1095629 RepID=A0A0C9X5G2_9AGAR|nr:hypothetical protein K443DRAFT_14136 [Laccaria amethystina LaAM-08-1]
MSLITISALVNADGSFAFPPFGLPSKRNISVHQVASVQGLYQIIYDTVFESTPVLTATPAWLGEFGPSGGSTLDGAIINDLTKTFATVKLGDGGGNGQWRPFTIVLTGHELLRKTPQHLEEAHE